MSDQELITQAEFARRHGVTRQAVHDWVQRGVITLHDGLVDEAEALAAIDQVRDPARVAKIVQLRQPALPFTAGAGDQAPAAPGPAEQTASSFAQAKTRREEAEAAMAELRLQQMSGNLLERDPVIKAVTDAASMLGSGLDRLTDKLAPRLAVESDEDAVRRLLTAEIDALRHEIATAITRLGQDLEKAPA